MLPIHFLIKVKTACPWPVWLGWLEPHPVTKALRFDSWSWHTSRLPVWSPAWAHTGNNQSMVLSCINVSFSSSLKAVKKCPQVRILKKNQNYQYDIRNSNSMVLICMSLIFSDVDFICVFTLFLFYLMVCELSPHFFSSYLLGYLSCVDFRSFLCNSEINSLPVRWAAKFCQVCNLSFDLPCGVFVRKTFFIDISNALIFFITDSRY